MSRFSDDLDLVNPEDYVPTSVQALLAHLHLHDAPRAEQETAIRDWLQTHPAAAGSLMEFTLKAKGFGHLLNEQPSR